MVTLVGLGLADRDRGQAARAEASWREAVRAVAPSAAGSPELPLLQSQALAFLSLGRVEEARPLVSDLQARGWQDADFLAPCRRHGLALRQGSRTPGPTANKR